MNKFSRLIVVSSIFCLVSLSLLFITAQTDTNIPYLSDTSHKVLASVNAILSKPVQFISQQRDAVSDLLVAYEENKELKQTIVSLRNQISEMDTLTKENDSLRNSLSIAEKYSGKGIIAGLVSVRTPVSWSAQLMISVGSNQGVAKEMLVVANGGLVGIVSEVYPNESEVKLLSSSDEFTKIPVRISFENKEIYGILSGYDTDTASFIVDQLNSGEEIPEGSNVVTSDLAGTLPSNIQIGKVKVVQSTNSNLNKKVFITPTANFSNIYSVLVVGSV